MLMRARERECLFLHLSLALLSLLCKIFYAQLSSSSPTLSFKTYYVKEKVASSKNAIGAEAAVALKKRLVKIYASCWMGKRDISESIKKVM